MGHSRSITNKYIRNTKIYIYIYIYIHAQKFTIVEMICYESTHSSGALLIYYYILAPQTPKSCSNNGSKSIFF